MRTNAGRPGVSCVVMGSGSRFVQRAARRRRAATRAETPRRDAPDGAGATIFLYG